MRFFSYRNKRVMRIALLTALAAAVLLALIVIGRISYLGRYVVYTDDGVVLDTEQSLSRTDAPPIQFPDETYPFSTLNPLETDGEQPDAASLRLSGYYVSTTMLAEQLPQVQELLARPDPEINAVVLDVKSPLGNFYYSTQIPGAFTADANIVACDALIAQLVSNPELVVIARVPAFSDPNYVTDHYAHGLQVYGGLWMDGRRCYWMDPSYTGVHDYLLSIALELEGLGFDEVLFDNFYVPDDGTILWDEDAATRQQALIDCAEDLAINLSGTSIRLDLGTDDPALAPYCSRFYLHPESVAELTAKADELAETFSDTAVSIVCQTDSRDTHFNDYSLVRSLIGEEESSFPDD